MIKATATTANGRQLLIVGLTFGNFRTFFAEPRDTFIRIDGKQMGLPMDVMIFSGETEADCAKLLQGGIGPDTKVHTHNEG